MEQSKPVDRPLRPGVTSRVIRPGEPEPADTDWMALTPEQRIDAVWTLTKAWNAEGDDDPRLQRSVVHIKRVGGLSLPGPGRPRTAQRR